MSAQHKLFDQFRVFEYDFAGRPLRIETGKMAGLANGACLVSYGDTVILATATASKAPRDGIDFLPLSVDYNEKMYAVGKIPGGYIQPPKPACSCPLKCVREIKISASITARPM